MSTVNNRKGPTRFSRYDSTSESSDSDFSDAKESEKEQHNNKDEIDDSVAGNAVDDKCVLSDEQSLNLKNFNLCADKVKTKVCFNQGESSLRNSNPSFENSETLISESISINPVSYIQSLNKKIPNCIKTESFNTESITNASDELNSSIGELPLIPNSEFQDCLLDTSIVSNKFDYVQVPRDELHAQTSLDKVNWSAKLFDSSESSQNSLLNLSVNDCNYMSEKSDISRISLPEKFEYEKNWQANENTEIVLPKNDLRFAIRSKSSKHKENLVIKISGKIEPHDMHERKFSKYKKRNHDHSACNRDNHRSSSSSSERSSSSSSSHHNYQNSRFKVVSSVVKPVKYSPPQMERDRSKPRTFYADKTHHSREMLKHKKNDQCLPKVAASNNIDKNDFLLTGKSHNASRLPVHMRLGIPSTPNLYIEMSPKISSAVCSEEKTNNKESKHVHSTAEVYSSSVKHKYLSSRRSLSHTKDHRDSHRSRSRR